MTICVNAKGEGVGGRKARIFSREIPLDNCSAGNYGNAFYILQLESAGVPQQLIKRDSHGVFIYVSLLFFKKFKNSSLIKQR